MDKVKVKTTQEGRKTEITFFNGKNQISSISKYINSCVVCKKVTVDDKDLGEKHVCAECLQMLKKSLDGVNVETTKENVVEKPAKTKEVKNKEKFLYRHLTNNKYKPAIKIVDVVEYQNLMPREVCEEIMTAIVDLILKGHNTVEKITNQLKPYSKYSIYTYMLTMSRAGMIYSVPKKPNQDMYTRTYKINSELTYTAV